MKPTKETKTFWLMMYASEAIKMEEEKAVIDADACVDCGVCVDECPVEAITME